MKKDNKKQAEDQDKLDETLILSLKEAEKKKLTEDLIVNGSCTYKFKVGTVSVVIRTLQWEEQEKLTHKLSAISSEVSTDKDGITTSRDLTVSEYNNEATSILVSAQLESIKDTPIDDIAKLSKNLVGVVAGQIRKLNYTIDNILLRVDNLKN